MSQKYLYSINPRKIINLEGVGPIRVAKSLFLDKKDVEYCLKYGTVYRRFGAENRNERVNITNLDRLHNEKYMTEEEYKLFLQSNIDNKRGTVINEEVKEPEKIDEEKIKEESINEVEDQQEKNKQYQKYNKYSNKNNKH